MNKETPKSYEQQLYDNCPALAKYEGDVLGQKQWVETAMLSQKGRAVASNLMGNQPHHPEAVPPDLLRYMRMFIKNYGNGDEANGVQIVFNALLAAGGHRHAPSLSAFLQHIQSEEQPVTH